MADVFISYKAEEFNEANWVKTTLETNGISCWMAPMSIPGGSNYAVEIPQAIRVAKVFVLILSEKSQLSKWVPRELDQAINSEKTILPFVLEDCPLKDDFNFYLSNVQRFAAYENKALAMERMITRIKAIIGVAKPVKESENIPSDEAVKGADNAKSFFVEKSEPFDNTEQNSVRKTKNSVETFDERKTPKIPKPIKVKTVKKRGSSPKERNRAANNKKVTFAVVAIAIAIVVLLPFVRYTAGHVTIAGQRYEKSISSISLKDKELTSVDLKNLSKCKKLSTVNLENCRFPLEELEILFKSADFRLELLNCGITNEALTKVNFEGVSIRNLKLDDNKSLTDLTPLSALSEQLELLSFNRCSVSDISFLNNFTRILYLEFAANKVSDISPLSACTAIAELDMSDNEIKTISPLLSCKSIGEISVNNNQLTSFEGLENSISLKKIKAENNKIESIDGLANATLLTEVDLSNNAISDMTLLEKSKENLRRLYIANNAMCDISFLKECTAINELDISGNKISSIESLGSLKGLTFLDASNNVIDNMAPLSNLENLNSLNLSNNKITTTVPIVFSEDSSYVTLDFSHNEITTLYISSNVSYRYLAFYGNPILSVPGLGELKGSEIVFEYSPDINFENLGKSSFSSYQVFDCPLDCQIRIGEMLGTYRTTFTNEEEYLKSKVEK